MGSPTALPTKPMMSDYTIQLFEHELQAQNKTHLDILEWGCGGSTRYYTNFLKQRGISYNWLSIENIAAWAANVANELKHDKGIQIHSEVDKPAYVNYPATLDRKFDLILVDGRQRKRCLQQALASIKDDGVVLLHDAGRSRYKGGFNGYADVHFLTYELKRGRIKSISTFNYFLNTLNLFTYAYLLKLFYKGQYAITRIKKQGESTKVNHCGASRFCTLFIGGHLSTALTPKIDACFFINPTPKSEMTVMTISTGIFSAVFFFRCYEQLRCGR